jgi:nitrate reductase NapE component
MRQPLKSLSIHEGWLIFLACFLIYFLNKQTITAGDNVPNTLLALNWFINHTLTFDNFNRSHWLTSKAYFFVEAPNGHYTSGYPIGTAIITFPIYCCFYLSLLISKGFHPVDITSLAFEAQRLSFEKIASVTVASLSVVIFYLATRLKFSQTVALISTFIYAFATGTWTISSQGLWQHGSTNLALLSVLLCLLKANRTEKKQVFFLVIAGICCGLLPGIRPTNGVFVIAIVLYSLVTYRKQSIYLLLGLSSALISVAWNFYYFNTLVGGYGFVGFLFTFTSQQFIEGFLGLLVSPSRGLLLFSPIVLYAIPGTLKILKLKSNSDEKLLTYLSLSSLALFIQYCFFIIWMAGYTYGPRFLTDILPVACFAINYTIAPRVQLINQQKQKLLTKGTVLFLITIFFSIFVQLVGAFGLSTWNGVPLDAGRTQNAWRWWEIGDSQIERQTRSVISQVTKPGSKPEYAQGLKGAILQLRDDQKQPLISPILTSPSSTLILKAKLKNTGTSSWIGYRMGAKKGEVTVRIRFFDRDYQLVSSSQLYVSGSPFPNETVNALGDVTFPSQPGEYKMIFDLVADKIGEIADVEGRSVTEIIAKVSPSKFHDLAALK